MYFCSNSALSVSAHEFVPRSGPRNTSQWAATAAPPAGGHHGVPAQQHYDENTYDILEMVRNGQLICTCESIS